MILNQRLVITTASGVLTAEDCLEHLRQLARDVSFNGDFRQLIDLTDVTKVDIDLNQMMELAERTPFSAKSRRALIAPTPVAFGLSRMYAGLRKYYGGEEEIWVFDNGDEAFLWLFKSFLPRRHADRRLSATALSA
jgi:hypothetical protein